MIKSAGKLTMTISELREKLNEYPQDMAVFATWEGVLAPFKPECFEKCRELEDGMPAGDEHLEIDVEAY